MRRMLAPPFLAENVDARHPRKLAMLKILDWLELHPGATWQARWNSSGAGTDGTADWRDQAVAELGAAGKLGHRGGELHHVLGTGMVQLIGGDVLRPGLPWLLATTSPSRVAEEMGRTRDPAGIAALKKLREGGTVGRATFTPAVERAALIMAAKGGLVADITPGDCIELLDCCRLLFAHGTRVGRHSPFFYQLLHMAGVFPPGAPPTVRMFSVKFAGQHSVEQLVDRYDLACRPVRDLLVDYLRERQPGIDYNTLVKLAVSLVLCFWKDLEVHHPGISSLHLTPGIAAGWKKRIKTRTVRTPGGGEQVVARQSADDVLMAIRGFYLDLAQWALDDPARWGPWAVPCPVRGSDIQYKQKSRTKARMDARTRERLPVMPALAASVDRERRDAAARLHAARTTPPGELFTAGGQTLLRARLTRTTQTTRIWAEEPSTGKRRDLTREEDNAFWSWATVEVLRHTEIFSRGAKRTCEAFSRFACSWPWLLSAVGATGVVERRTGRRAGASATAGSGVELGHELAVGCPCRGEVVAAFFELEAEIGGLLFEVGDLLGERVDVGGGAEPGFPPCLLAEGFGEAFFKLVDAGGQAGRSFVGGEQVCLQ
jgi:hypothetical protein